MERFDSQRRYVRDQREVQAAMAVGAFLVFRGGGNPDMACGAHARLDPGCFVQGGVETEAGAGEPEEDGGASARVDGAGAVEDLQGAAGEVRGGGGAVPGGARRGRRRLRPGVRGGAARARRE